nr:hypothetical protein [Tanacetum cinerariifolium]
MINLALSFIMHSVTLTSGSVRTVLQYEYCTCDQVVDTSLIHIESRKPPTAKLFDVDSGRISIHHYSISAPLIFGTRRLEWTATFSISMISE